MLCKYVPPVGMIFVVLITAILLEPFFNFSGFDYY